MPQQKYLPNCPQKNKKNFWQLIMIRKKELGIHCVVLPFTVAILAVRVIVIYFIEKYLYGWTTTASTPLKISGATFMNRTFKF
jgi:hypothetical protein